MTSTSTKKFDHIVSFGCSLAYGDELADRNRRYSSLIAKKLNTTLVDHSVVSFSNEMISQTLINNLLANKHGGDPSKTLVLVQWSFASRFNFSGKNNKYYVLANYNLSPTDRKLKLGMGHKQLFFNDDFEDMMDLKFYYDRHSNPTYMMYNLLRCVHHAQTFLKNKGYNYIFLFGGVYEKDMVMSSKLYDVLGLSESEVHDSYPHFYYTINDIDNNLICPTTFVEYAQLQKCKFGQFGHPLEDGHFYYSKVLMEFIESKYGQKE